MKLEDLGTRGERRTARDLIETPGIWVLTDTMYRAVELLYEEVGKDVPPNVLRSQPIRRGHDDHPG
jgi:hypothetical protein